MDDKTNDTEWLKQQDRIDFMQSDLIATPWFPAFKCVKSTREGTRWFSALVPVSVVKWGRATVTNYNIYGKVEKGA